jgi:hypothetical protein
MFTDGTLMNESGQRLEIWLGGGDLEATHKQVDGDALWKAFGAPSSESSDEFNLEDLDPAIDAAFKVLRPGPAT